MPDRPILFSAPMVRAIIAGHKTQTRRLLRPQPACMGTWYQWPHNGGWNVQSPSRILGVLDLCPYGSPGDRLWVREAHAWADTFLDGYDRDPPCRVAYRADGAFTSAMRDPQTGADTLIPLDVAHPNLAHPSLRWRPSIHMPRWAARIWLHVEDVRVERLQTITGADVIAEGVGEPMEGGETLEARFAALWDSINADRAPWASNPWVWVVRFSVLSVTGRPEVPDAR